MATPEITRLYKGWNCDERKAYIEMEKDKSRDWDMKDKRRQHLVNVIRENNRAWLHDRERFNCFASNHREDPEMATVLSRKAQSDCDRRSYVEQIAERKASAARYEKERIERKQKAKEEAQLKLDEDARRNRAIYMETR